MELLKSFAIWILIFVSASRGDETSFLPKVLQDFLDLDERLGEETESSIDRLRLRLLQRYKVGNIFNFNERPTTFLGRKKSTVCESSSKITETNAHILPAIANNFFGLEVCPGLGHDYSKFCKRLPQYDLSFNYEDEDIEDMGLYAPMVQERLEEVNRHVSVLNKTLSSIEQNIKWTDEILNEQNLMKNNLESATDQATPQMETIVIDQLHSESEKGSNNTMEFFCPLKYGFRPGSQIEINGKLPENAVRFSINLQKGLMTYDADIALHFNPRFNENQVVYNTKYMGSWEDEIYQPLTSSKGKIEINPFKLNDTIKITVKTDDHFFLISINDFEYGRFEHRYSPKEITHIRIFADLQLESIVYKTTSYSFEEVHPNETELVYSKNWCWFSAGAPTPDNSHLVSKRNEINRFKAVSAYNKISQYLTKVKNMEQNYDMKTKMVRAIEKTRANLKLFSKYETNLIEQVQYWMEIIKNVNQFEQEVMMGAKNTILPVSFFKTLLDDAICIPQCKVEVDPLPRQMRAYKPEVCMGQSTNVETSAVVTSRPVININEKNDAEDEEEYDYWNYTFLPEGRGQLDVLTSKTDTNEQKDGGRNVFFFGGNAPSVEINANTPNIEEDLGQKVEDGLIDGKKDDADENLDSADEGNDEERKRNLFYQRWISMLEFQDDDYDFKSPIGDLIKVDDDKSLNNDINSLENDDDNGLKNPVGDLIKVDGTQTDDVKSLNNDIKFFNSLEYDYDGLINPVGDLIKVDGTQTDDIKSLNNDINSLEYDYDGLINPVGDLIKVYGTQTDDVKSLNNDIKSLEVDDDGLKNPVGDLNKADGTQTNDVKSLNYDINSLEDDDEDDDNFVISIPFDRKTYSDQLNQLLQKRNNLL